MKNLKIIICLSILLLFGSVKSFALTGIVNTPAVRIREEASTDSKVLTKAYEDDEVEILGEEENWYKVKVKDITGYASKDLIKKKEEPNSSNSENKVEENKVEENKVDVNSSEVPEENSGTGNTENTYSKVLEDTVGRVLPNFSSNEVILLTKDTEIKVLGTLKNWSEVEVENTRVWVLNKKLSVADEAIKPQPETKPNEENEPVKPEENTTLEENTTIETDTNTSTQNTTQTNTSTNNKKGIINVETANVREKADKSSKIIHRLDENDEVTIVAEEGDWYKITNSEVESGYVSKTLITLSKEVSSRDEESRQISSTNEDVNDVAEFSKQYLGYSYVLGGKTPETGFDCSGFTKYVFGNYGYTLGSIAADQNSIGAEIERTDLKAGDLILFQDEGKTKIGHTGIYIGNNEFIHAANPDRGVVIDNLETNSYYSTRFVTARRIVE